MRPNERMIEVLYIVLTGLKWRDVARQRSAVPVLDGFKKSSAAKKECWLAFIDVSCRKLAFVNQLQYMLVLRMRTTS
jgi:hypothetical protein